MAWFTAPRGIELLGCFCTNLNCKARNTPVDKTGVNFSGCSQGVLRTVDAPSLLFRLNRALELIRCCEKELCEIQTRMVMHTSQGNARTSSSPAFPRLSTQQPSARPLTELRAGGARAAQRALRAPPLGAFHSRCRSSR